MKCRALLVSAVVLATLTLSAGAEEPTVRVVIPVKAYEIAETAHGQDILLEGFGYLLAPGKPKLPSRVFSVAIPPGAEVVGVDFDAGEGVVLAGSYDIAPAPLPRVIGQEDPSVYRAEKQRYDENYRATYGNDDAYPPRAVEFVRSAGYRQYNLVDVRVTPFAYRPLSGRLVYYPDVTVEVRYRLPDKRAIMPVDNLVRTERIADEIILNRAEAEAWYPLSPAKSRGLFDFVIITLDSLTSSVTPLVDWETSKGRTVRVVTTSWINTTYPGGYDLAENMRNFLRDKYPSGEWGIEDVLLVGHYDHVPMRRTAQDVGYGQPETDYYYAELSLPDDQSWDDDEDHQYGENSDPIDFYAEVNVGRIPYSDSTTVSSICNKSVAYEQNEPAAFKRNMLLLGSFFWEDTDNAELMEAKIDNPVMTDWTFTRMYEQNSTVYSTFPCDYELRHSTVQSVWPAGTYAFVNWAGHGSPTSSHIMGYSSEAFITSSDCALLDDDYPAIIFADACSNHDTDDNNNIGRAMLGQGAVGFVGSNKVAFGCPGWNDPSDGSSQSMDYYFTTKVTINDYTQGAAHQWALRQMYIYGLWYYPRYETFEWGALLGNPNLGMGVPALVCDPPPVPADPEPTDGAVDVPVDADLAWNDGAAAPAGRDVTELRLDAVHRGWWQDSGFHQAANRNTTTGQLVTSSRGGPILHAYHSYFVFDVRRATMVTTAGLRLELVDYFSPDSSESVTVYDVSTDAATLMADGMDVAIFNDLGTGNAYASFVVSAADVGTVVEIPLNAQAIADINAASNSFSVGLRVDDIASTTLDEGVLFSNTFETRIHQLVVDGDPCLPIYDVYFGTENPPTTKIYSGDPEPVCDPGLLECETTYHWQVCAENPGHEVCGDVWSFTTESDFECFADCLLGPAGGLGANCDPFDFDGDGDVDLKDFAEFQEAFTGPL